MHSSYAPPQSATLQNKNGMHFSCKFTREKAGITGLAAGFFFLPTVQLCSVRFAWQRAGRLPLYLSRYG